MPGAARQTIRLILDAGYVDCYRLRHPREPGYTYPSDAPWLRLDDIFAAQSLARCLVECDVATSTQALQASDHLPVWAEFRGVTAHQYRA